MRKKGVNNLEQVKSDSDSDSNNELLSKTEKIKELEEIFKNFGLEELLILQTPDYKLHSCECIKLKKESDFEKIPRKKGGVYFITTNENINHSFHNKNKNFPKQYNDFTIIYNGTSSDLYSRAKNHLFRNKNKGMSGISVDILSTEEKVESHTKCCFSTNKRKKTPFIIESGKRISEFNQCYELNISEKENTFLTENTDQIIYFRNGINVFSDKHLPFEWIFHYLVIENHSVRDIVETLSRQIGEKNMGLLYYVLITRVDKFNSAFYYKSKKIYDKKLILNIPRNI